MKIPLLVALLLLLGGCSDNPEAPPKTQSEKKPYNPWETQMKALDNARNLEGQILQDARDRDKQIREQGG
jgi:PBP1b-binding outer membrane lipoprotein LpoB